MGVFASKYQKRKEIEIKVKGNILLKRLEALEKINSFNQLIIWPIGLVLYIIGLFDTGSPFFIQERVGKNKKPFRLVKFRTMRKDTKSVASHLADPAVITKFGHFLRKTKLDELPQDGGKHFIYIFRDCESSILGYFQNTFKRTGSDFFSK